jgi:hypothetical protein
MIMVEPTGLLRHRNLGRLAAPRPFDRPWGARKQHMVMVVLYLRGYCCDTLTRGATAAQLPRRICA